MNKRRMHQGVSFRDFIVSSIEKKQAQTYLEIGVRDGATLAKVNCACIGVDPAFDFTTIPIVGKKELHLYQTTSDLFFKTRDPRAIFGRSVDVVFLDGLHLFEYLLRDFMNSEAICEKDSLIILDDCLPANGEMTERYHNPDGRSDKEFAGWWTGDVWKILPVLKKYRKDLRISAVDTSPCGSVCITNLDPSSTILRTAYFDILDEVAQTSFDFDDFYCDLTLVESARIVDRLDASIWIGS